MLRRAIDLGSRWQRSRRLASRYSVILIGQRLRGLLVGRWYRGGLLGYTTRVYRLVGNSWCRDWCLNWRLIRNVVWRNLTTKINEI